MSSPTAIHGLWPALLIPVYPNQSIDTPRAITHAQRMLAAGSDGVTLFGTTGEGPAFTVAELARRHPGQIIGIKDSSGDLAHAQALARAFPQLSIFVGTEPHIAPTMLVGGSGSINGLANIAPRLLRRVIDAPSAVSADDTQLMTQLLTISSAQPGMNFVTVYKTLLIEQTGDDAWLQVRSPLSPLLAAEQ